MATPSEEGQPREDAPQSPQPGQSAQKPTRRRGVIAGAAALSIIVILFATLFYALGHKVFSTASAAPTPTVPTNWQRYTDPGGYFSVSIPEGWTAQRQDGGKATMGNNSGSFTTQDIFDTLGEPPRGQNSITVQVLIEPLPNDFARQWECGAWPPARNNATVAGVPAIHFEDNIWLLTTNAAHFQIDYTYPNWQGNVNIPANAPTATPMPPGFYDRGQQEIKTILASFLPNPDTPLTCK